MATDQEIALVQAQGSGEQKNEIYWIFSRAQIEFVLKELDLVQSSVGGVKARYQEMVLPVLSLEKYFGLAGQADLEKGKYAVIRSVDTTKKLRRLIVHNSFSPHFQLLDSTITSIEEFSLPEHSEYILGAYALGEGKVGVVPDVVSICRALD